MLFIMSVYLGGFLLYNIKILLPDDIRPVSLIIRPVNENPYYVYDYLGLRGDSFSFFRDAT